MGGGKSADATIRVPRYHMSIHMGLCLAKAGAKILRIKIGDKVAWRGAQEQGGPLFITKPHLFGGLKKEGGVYGVAYWLPGDRDQVLPNALAKRYGFNSGANCPGYRGIASLFFVGRRSVGTSPAHPDEWSPGATGGGKGFYWGANNPYARDVEVRLFLPAIGLNPATAAIPIYPNRDDSIMGVNGAHMIYECLRDHKWGAGLRVGGIDKAAFEKAAQTLYDENFALCAYWSKQSTIEAFVNEVLDHVNMTLFLHPVTGLITPKLLRNDYDMDDLVRITPGNARFKSFGRRVWGDQTANEIVVSYTNPATKKPASISAQDLAAIAAQGGTVSASRDFHMLRSARLAAKVARRELAQSVMPMGTFEFELTRALGDLIPGEAVVVAGWSERCGVDYMLCRVNKITPPTVDAPYGIADIYEDIWSTARSEYDEDVETDWESPSAEPAPITKLALVTAPAALMAQAKRVEDPALLRPAQTMVLMLPARNGPDDVNFDVYAPTVVSTGTTEMRSRGLRDYAGTAELAAGMAAAIESTVTVENLDGDGPRTGQFVLIGNPGDNFEIAAVSVVTDETTWTLVRGALDTVPKAWGEGTMLWLIPQQGAIIDTTARAIGETVSYKIVTTTSLDTLDLETSPDYSIVTDSRPHRPFRPANVMVDGERFGQLDVAGRTSVAVTWATRNRTLETSHVLRWGEASVPPEEGQTSVIRLYNSDGAAITELNAGSATSYTVPLSAFGGNTDGYLQVLAKRENLYSYQGLSRRLINIRR